jgi:Ca-activated chloride channel family protein
VKFIARLIGCLVLCSPLTALADPAPSRNGTPDEPGAGQLWLDGPEDEPWLAPQVSTEVHIVVTGMIARTKLEQVFENPSEEAVEAVYVFPLPEGAAVDGLSLRVGEREIKGEVREREAAERVFAQAANAGKKASLVSQERPNLFTTSVANIGPGETVHVSIHYQEDVRYDHGTFSITVPSTVTPRYSPGAAVEGDVSALAMNQPRVADAARITPPTALDGSGPLFDVWLELDAGMPLASLDSPTHEIEVEHSTERDHSVRLSDGPVLADRDFRLRWRPEPSAAPTSAVFTEDFAGESYALVMLVPPSAGADAAGALARETTFVIDTSGSMAGTSITQAKGSLRTGLAALAPNDSFNVIEFNSAARGLFDVPRPATPDNIARAQRWVDALNADGGTEMLDALSLALSAPQTERRVQQLVFITDGSVGNEDELFRVVGSSLGDRRLFTVGIGAAPNRHFMRGAARFGRGTFIDVGTLTEVESRMDELWAKLEAPVMRDVTLGFTGPAPEVWPRQVPDLYLGEPLVVLAKLGKGTGAVSVAGSLAGQSFKRQLALGQATSERGIHRLWARRAIEALLDRSVLGEDEAAIRAQVVPLALRHHLVSKYTSLVAVDRVVTADGRAPRASVANALPAGSEMFGNMPSTATPGPFCLLFGAASLAAAAIVQRRIVL